MTDKKLKLPEAGQWPDKLVVPPALEKNARDILVADYINGTRNTMQGTAKPVVVPRLSGAAR